MKKEKQIKHELDEHLDKTVKIIKDNNGWNTVNIPLISQNELIEIAQKEGLQNDEQTRSFCKFISIGTNFASMNFVQRFQTIPDLVVSICDLIERMENEIKDFEEDICTDTLNKLINSDLLNTVQWTSGNITFENEKQQLLMISKLIKNNQSIYTNAVQYFIYLYYITNS